MAEPTLKQDTLTKLNRGRSTLEQSYFVTADHSTSSGWKNRGLVEPLSNKSQATATTTTRMRHGKL